MSQNGLRLLRRTGSHGGQRRGLVSLAVASVVAVLLAGCAGGSEAGKSSAPPAAAGAFPVTIPSALGDAVIAKAPHRIVTIGWGAADTAVALGTTPVGVEKATWGGDADGYFPWVRDAVEKRGDDLPKTFDVYPEVDVEAVLALKPDLILAPQSGITQDDFTTLSAIAPTVAYPDKPWLTPWDTEITIIGKALGKSAEADHLVSGINETFGDTKKNHPEFTGVSFAYVYAAEPGQLQLYQRGDPRVDLIANLGLTPDTAVSAVPLTAGTFTSTVGLERADVLDKVDVLFTWFNDTANEKAIEAQPLFAQIPAVKRGSYVPNTDNQLAMASSMITPLSVPWALKAYVPEIEAAVAKVGK